MLAGLNDALNRLPPYLRSLATRELDRLLDDAGYGFFSELREVWFRGRREGERHRALALIGHSTTFEFHFLFVRDRARQSIPVVGDICLCRSSRLSC